MALLEKAPRKCEMGRNFRRRRLSRNWNALRCVFLIRDIKCFFLEVVVIAWPAAALGHVGVALGLLLLPAARVVAGRVSAVGAGRPGPELIVVVSVPFGLPAVVELALVGAGRGLGVAAAAGAGVVGLALLKEDKEKAVISQHFQAGGHFFAEK